MNSPFFVAARTDRLFLVQLNMGDQLEADENSVALALLRKHARYESKVSSGGPQRVEVGCNPEFKDTK